MDTKTLEMLGLEQKQAKIYLALLQLKQATATKISEDTRIERTLCYSIINKLIDKGLISYIIQNNVKYFVGITSKKSPFWSHSGHILLTQRPFFLTLYFHLLPQAMNIVFPPKKKQPKFMTLELKFLYFN